MDDKGTILTLTRRRNQINEGLYKAL